MRQRVDLVNSLRAIALLGVIWTHIFQDAISPRGAYVIYLGASDFNFLPLTFLSNGWLGVNLFFMLSGFVLYLPYANDTRHMAGAADFKTYYFRRARRLLPLYYASLVVFIAYDYFANGSLASYWHQFLYFSTTFTFDRATFLPVNNWVLWTLGLEIWFSIFFPFLIIAARRFGIGRVLYFVLALSLITRIGGNHVPGIDLTLNPVKDSIFGRLDDFVVGMWICHVFIHPPLKKPSSGWLLGCGLFVIFVVASLWDYIFMGLIPLTVRPFLNNLVHLGTACIMLGLLFADKSRLVRILMNTPLQVFGMMCFSTYIWHGRLIEILHAKDGIANLVFYFIALLLWSALTYRFIEFGYVRDWRPLFRLPPKRLSE
jgi:peptidoglycan/LPS O-acetylase OafA/YrhL